MYARSCSPRSVDHALAQRVELGAECTRSARVKAVVSRRACAFSLGTGGRVAWGSGAAQRFELDVAGGHRHAQLHVLCVGARRARRCGCRAPAPPACAWCRCGRCPCGSRRRARARPARPARAGSCRHRMPRCRYARSARGPRLRPAGAAAGRKLSLCTCCGFPVRFQIVRVAAIRAGGPQTYTWASRQLGSSVCSRRRERWPAPADRPSRVPTTSIAKVGPAPLEPLELRPVGVFAPLRREVQERDRTRVLLVEQRAQHRQHGRDSAAPAEQQDALRSRVRQHELAHRLAEAEDHPGASGVIEVP